MAVYFNNNSKLFIPTFTNKLAAPTLPSGPEFLQQASFRPDQPRRPMHRYSLKALNPSQPGRT